MRRRVDKAASGAQAHGARVSFGGCARCPACARPTVRPRAGSWWAPARRTPFVSSRVARARFARNVCRDAGVAQPGAPTIMGRGGTAARHGDQPVLAGRPRQVRSAQGSGAPARVLHSPPARPLQPCSTLSRSLCVAFVRRVRAGSTTVTITTATEVAIVVAVASGSRIDAAVLLSLMQVAAGSLEAALEQLRRRFGGRGGAAARRPSPGGSGGRSRGREWVADGIFAPGCRFFCVYRNACTKMLVLRRCGCLCVRSMCA